MERSRRHQSPTQLRYSTVDLQVNLELATRTDRLGADPVINKGSRGRLFDTRADPAHDSHGIGRLHVVRNEHVIVDPVQRDSASDLCESGIEGRAANFAIQTTGHTIVRHAKIETGLIELEVDHEILGHAIRLEDIDRGDAADDATGRIADGHGVSRGITF